MLWIQFRTFSIDCDGDYRPVKWPIKYPYWCVGESGDFTYTDDEKKEFNPHHYFILVSYADSVDYIKELWPEAQLDSIEEVDSIIFSDRFPKPTWYTEENF